MLNTRPVFSTTDFARWRDAQITGDQPVTINVPSDISTLPDALVAAAEIVPNAEIEAVVNIESGHTIENAVAVTNTDFSHVTITSEDDTVTVGSSFPSDANLIQGTNATMPTLDCLINIQENAQKGIYLNQNAVMKTTVSAGVENTAAQGADIEGGSTSLPPKQSSARAAQTTSAAARGQLQLLCEPI
ncbi:hypothetical protein [Halalkalicoccus salilacus]|uniref:hypothetical protein n=1 Tax=Halalkalicoccus salilacus TaxID=3117459 RepID=UPI00300E7FED